MIQIDIKDKIPVVVGEPEIVCGNSTYSIELTFDSEWDAFPEKTARFRYFDGSEEIVKDVDFSGNKVNVPILTNTLLVKFGVFAGELSTTAPACIPCRPSVLCGGDGTGKLPPVADSVRYTSQDRTDEEKAQARENISAASTAEVAAVQAHADASVAAVQKQTDTSAARISLHEKRITNLEKGIIPDPFITDSSTSIIKQNPENVLPYASVDVVGGKTRKCRNLAVSSEETTTTQNGLTLNRYAQKSIVVLNGTATTDNAVRLFGTFKLPAGTYTASVYGLNATDRIYVGETNNVIINYIQTNAPKTFTLDEEKECFIQVVYVNGSVYNNTEVKVQIEKGSVVTDYKPYFEGLRNTAVSEFESVGKNILKRLGLKPQTNTHNGVTITVNEDCSITLDGTATSEIFPSFCSSGFPNSTWVEYKNAISVLEDYYTVTVKTISGSRQGSSNHIAVGFYDQNKDPSTFTTDIDSSSVSRRLIAKFNSIFASIRAGDTFNNFTFAIQFEKGSVATEIVEPTVNTLSIPEAVQAIDGYGWGVSDTVYNYVDWEKKQFVKKVGKVVYNGTERWYLDRYNSHGAYVYNTTLISTPLAISDKFTRSEGSWGEKGVGYFSPNGTHIYFNSDKATVEEWKAYLAENPVTVYYELAEPVITDISELLSPDNMLEVYEGGTVEVVTDDDYAEAVPTTITYATKGAER